jgi:hypothetical protein
VEISAIAVEDEHKEEFGVQARGWDVVRGEAGDGGGEGRLQLHVYISTHGVEWEAANSRVVVENLKNCWQCGCNRGPSLPLGMTYSRERGGGGGNRKLETGN